MKVYMAVAVAALSVGTVSAAELESVPTEQVNVSDLRQDTAEGQAKLFSRLHAAAARVCAPQASSDRLNFREARCVRDAMDRALEQIPGLAQVERKRKIRHG